jgi:hypothetical protein
LCLDRLAPHISTCDGVKATVSWRYCEGFASRTVRPPWSRGVSGVAPLEARAAGYGLRRLRAALAVLSGPDAINSTRCRAMDCCALTRSRQCRRDTTPSTVAAMDCGALVPLWLCRRDTTPSTVAAMDCGALVPLWLCRRDTATRPARAAAMDCGSLVRSCPPPSRLTPHAYPLPFWENLVNSVRTPKTGRSTATIRTLGEVAEGRSPRHHFLCNFTLEMASRGGIVQLFSSGQFR